MKKVVFLTLSTLVLTSFFIPIIVAQESRAEINFFYSETCPHCHEESKFLDTLEEDYGDQIQVNRYTVSDPIRDSGNLALVRNFAEEAGIGESVGLVPITFISDDAYVGYTDKAVPPGIYPAIATPESIMASIEEIVGPLERKEGKSGLFANIDYENYSLPVLAALMGFLDGFNVCSLGALIIILGLVLQLQSRRKIMLYGGIFIFTTALIYGFLINLWYQFFTVAEGYLGILRPLIGILGVVGGAYFIKEFFRLRNVGLVCKTTGASFIDKMTKRTEKIFNNPHNILYIAGGVLLFAAIITLVEFPCSAAVPVAFAGLLAEQGIGNAASLGLMAIFIFFYLLDEIIVFALAVWKMRIVSSSPELTTWATLLEGLFLLALGIYYISSIL
ncbi:MAG: hypothetical protein COT88_01605 [Candidatus Colwellbacteria bacterium CG10_big_fil_rev_8_21_14_0_10_41_28]|uniref:Thioredoxin domain-containing protein n=1 Tax=Candidatus Colwellbacteria bacterium CG10_big_fil_rev_8_21_14_0_10_41_28 TaxID=1974539 RepID=A0A2H0VHB7_9BACT|nr:MAG: hypothetical protein COT88_01605 [Candidatus Colwellbacteria bacterium CG10_big_fil_rev_8_21_14_0_10_41_28]